MNTEKERADNLSSPLPGDFGADGSFAAEAVDSSTQLWMTGHRRLPAETVAGVAGLAAGALLVGNAGARQ
jgi:hypothetical protein